MVLKVPQANKILTQEELKACPISMLKTRTSQVMMPISSMRMTDIKAGLAKAKANLTEEDVHKNRWRHLKELQKTRSKVITGNQVNIITSILRSTSQKVTF